jgi:N6-L-threonylcarbamoyladenine synthase
VVPELASRDHIRRVLPLLDTVLAESGRTLADIDALAVTTGPGLAGALLVGASIGHALGYALGKPVLDVHHLEGHLLSPLLAQPAPVFPFVALLVSGGHTQLLAVRDWGRYELLGETLDDAAGEAFDKTAQLLGLGYPGGPAVSRAADFGTPGAIRLPRPMLHSHDLDFSFSGLKTAVLTAVRRDGSSNVCEQARADIARGFVDAIVDVLTAKTLRALEQTGLATLVVAGGVGANRQLRERLQRETAGRGATVHFPPMNLCTDNGAMIALAGLAKLRRVDPSALARSMSFSVRPRWTLAEATA